MEKLVFPGFFCANLSRTVTRNAAPRQAEHKCTEWTVYGELTRKGNWIDSAADNGPRPENQDQRKDKKDQRPESVEKGEID